jgi:Pentapeptide repeats (8 copies)
MLSLTTNSVRRCIRPVVPGPVWRTAPGTILLTSRFSGGRLVNCLGYSWISPGGGRAYHFVSSGTNHARKEPDRSRDSPVTLLHCSIRTHRIRTALATRRAQRGSPGQGWRVRTGWLAQHDVGAVTGSLHETALDNARGRLLTLGAGLIAVAALVFTARSFTPSREGQVTDRYTKATEQLGSEKADVRIGGMYALERIAHDSARDRPTVMEVITAFIREHSHDWVPHAVETPDGPQPPETARPDIRTALSVVGRRYAKRDIRPVDLRGADLSGLNLRGANLRRVNLAGTQYADFRSADLEAEDLAGADIAGVNWPAGLPAPTGWKLSTERGGFPVTLRPDSDAFHGIVVIPDERWPRTRRSLRFRVRSALLSAQMRWLRRQAARASSRKGHDKLVLQPTPERPTILQPLSADP